MFVVGVAVWAMASAVTVITQDPLLVPTVIVVGSFAIPVAVVVSVLHREDSQVGSGLRPGVMLEAFLGGGTLGLLLSALLETYLLPRTGTNIIVGFVEETSKGLVIVGAALKLRSRDPLDGMVLGAVVGAGFAAFESAGYAFNSYVSSGSRPFLQLLETELNRAFGSPFGHIVWTALLGGALFAAEGGRRFRLTASLIVTFIGVVALHAFWDQAYGWAIVLAQGVTGAGWHPGAFGGASWEITPTHVQLNVFNVLYDSLLVVVAAVGAAWFATCWRRYRRVQQTVVAARAM